MTKVTEQDLKDLSKALNYANWSVLGLFIPFIGWFLAGISLSFIKTVPYTESTSRRIQQVKRAAWGGLIISSVAFAAWGGIYKYNISEQAQTVKYYNCLESKSAEARIKIENNQEFVGAMYACSYLKP